MPQTPFDGTQAAALKRAVVRGTSTSAASPNTIAFQIPEKGIYLATFSIWENNPNHRAQAVAVVMWYSNSGTNWVLGCDVLGSPHFVNEPTALTFAAPSTAGVVTGTLTWTGGVSRGLNGVMDLRQLSGPLDGYGA